MCSAKILLAMIFNEIDVMSALFWVWWWGCIPNIPPSVRACARGLKQFNLLTTTPCGLPNQTVSISDPFLDQGCQVS